MKNKKEETDLFRSFIWPVNFAGFGLITSVTFYPIYFLLGLFNGAIESMLSTSIPAGEIAFTAIVLCNICGICGAIALRKMVLKDSS